MSGGGKLTANTNEGPLADDPADARWIPVELVITVPNTMSLVVVAKIGDDSVLTMVAYSDELDGLQPLFLGKSTYETTEDFPTERIVTLSLLPNGGWIRESVTLVPYIAWEATA